MYDPTESHSTADPAYSPWQLLPAPEARYDNPDPDYFYQNVAKHLIKDTVRIMSNGIAIDLNSVSELEQVLDDQLQKVADDLASNPYIQQFLELTHKDQITAYKAERASMLRSEEYYLKPFNYKDMIHRSYFMHFYSKSQGFTGPPDEVYPGISKWDAKTVKKLSTQYPILSKLLNGTLSSHPLAIQAMQLLAQHKCDLYNQKFLDQIANPNLIYPTFNPASPTQKQALFAMLGIESESTSATTGDASFNRAEIERINKETDDDHIKHLTQCFIDHSYAAIVRNNFIEAFYKYTINGRLYGQLRLFGAKSFRLTSNNPNLLNLPSTGSIFAKPIKQCFIAPSGRVILSADYGALENRVIANLSGDENLSNIYLQNLDGHCMNSLYYFREEIAQHIPLTGDPTIDAKVYYDAIESGNKDLKAIRQKGKNPSFGMQYGAYPPKIAKSIKCTLEEAETIFNRYHNELYPSVTKFREEYVEPTVQQHHKIHMGLGCYMHTDNPDKDVRTLVNGCSQFWSILTLLTINELHHRIDAANLGSQIKVISSIYDSIYIECEASPPIIKWVNDNLIECMTQDFMLNQHVPNEATAEIGLNWADLHQIPNNATLEQITTVLESL